MYMALGVDGIDTILPAPQEPPHGPWTRKFTIITWSNTRVFPGQDHTAISMLTEHSCHRF